MTNLNLVLDFGSLIVGAVVGVVLAYAVKSAVEDIAKFFKK